MVQADQIQIQIQVKMLSYNIVTLLSPIPGLSQGLPPNNHISNTLGTDRPAGGAEVRALPYFMEPLCSRSDSSKAPRRSSHLQIYPFPLPNIDL